MAKLSYLASVSETRKVLERFGLNTKKSLGQHFLINDGVVSKICDLAQVSKDDVVIEVGPGIGTLTVALLKQAGHVISVERDTDLPQVLEYTCSEWEESFTLISGDALEVTPESLSAVYPELPCKLISNLPYAVAATIVLDLFEKLDCMQSATVMVQAEVADRMAASPGTKNYGAYTVKLNLYAKPAGRFSVSEGNFFPQPRVKSAVIKLERNADYQDMSPELRKATMIMADAAFANRRKTIANSCKSYFTNEQTCDDHILQHLSDIFERASIAPNERGEHLTLEQFISLGEAYRYFLEK
ncbi:MAG: 16S rRNA (adenine(1518)-N(6)/adenine(1519)-N(6))-dimethyltransferase RsmA [Anaerotardibacter sp.]